ncbi:MAG: hypothetical protein HRU06_15150 [Oceanospirillaceae bacterium]|nr:hypothetical protein [Oceanospirillaceae bacterium]
MHAKLRSAELLVKTAMADPGIMKDLKENPEKALRQLQDQVVNELPPRALEQDIWIYRIVVASLSLAVLLVVIGVLIITIFPAVNEAGKIVPVAIPDILTALGAAAIGALAGLLAPAPSS